MYTADKQPATLGPKVGHEEPSHWGRGRSSASAEAGRPGACDLQRTVASSRIPVRKQYIVCVCVFIYVYIYIYIYYHAYPV